jgi:signal transduction histidine kinase
MNVYSPQGTLEASSQPDIFNNQLLSNFVNRVAWSRLVEEDESYVVNKEEIGLLKFNNAYLAMRDPATGDLLAILNLPFFRSVDQIDRSQAIVLSNILIVFVGVFIFFSILSYYAVKWLTFPLAFITKTLRDTTLGSSHYLEWKSDDEIGLMVNEYNRMVVKLEVSRIELARRQKESAWREMAQQVAHEIKNPLTPMKLALQQMQLSIQRDEERGKTVQMLLGQVEILNQIASSFSTFAKMPTPLLERKDIVEVVKRTVGLYVNHSSGTTEVSIETAPVFVMLDEHLIGRVISNLILNGLQAGREGQSVRVAVVVSRRRGDCVVLIRDDGIGMGDETKERVFVPYFSTKKTGSGLGLAIAKQGIEQCGGSISFVSKLGEGTEFEIVLPTC